MTWMMGMKEVARLFANSFVPAIHSFQFTGSVKRKQAPPLELLSDQIRPPDN
jgi:hypothetical protein